MKANSPLTTLRNVVLHGIRKTATMLAKSISKHCHH